MSVQQGRDDGLLPFLCTENLHVHLFDSDVYNRERAIKIGKKCVLVCNKRYKEVGLGGGLLPPVMAHLGLLTRILRRKKMKVGEEGEMQAVRRKIKKAETP